MGLIINGQKMAKPLINGVPHNCFINGQKIWNDKVVDNTVLNGLLLWCSGVKSDKTASLWSDISGNNKHITMSNATVVDNGYAFNGTNTLGNIPVNMNFLNNGGAIACIVKYDVIANYKGVIGEAPPSGNSGVVFGQHDSPLGGVVFGMHPPTDNSKIQAVPATSAFFTNGINSYNEIVMTYDKSLLNGYFNGVLKFSKSIGQVTMRSANMVIGRALNESNRYLKGNVRDVKFYNRALTANEVLANYNQNQSEGLVG